MKRTKSRVKIEQANWSKVFGLIAKLVRYGKGGYSHIEKMDLVSDLLSVIGAVSEDIKEDIDAERKEEDK